MNRLLFFCWIVALTGCGWERKVSFQEPNGNAAVEILQPFPFNAAGIRVVLKDRGQGIKLFDKRADTFLSFADVGWPQDHSFVTVFACVGGTTIELAFNRIKQVPTSFETLAPTAVKHIRSVYALPDDVHSDADVFKWACSDGEKAFLTHHPEATPR